MKILFTLFLLFSSSSLFAAQWAINTANKYDSAGALYSDTMIFELSNVENVCSQMSINNSLYSSGYYTNPTVLSHTNSGTSGIVICRITVNHSSTSTSLTDENHSYIVRTCSDGIEIDPLTFDCQIPPETCSDFQGQFASVGNHAVETDYPTYEACFSPGESLRCAAFLSGNAFQLLNETTWRGPFHYNGQDCPADWTVQVSTGSPSDITAPPEIDLPEYTSGSGTTPSSGANPGFDESIPTHEAPEQVTDTTESTKSQDIKRLQDSVEKGNEAVMQNFNKGIKTLDGDLINVGEDVQNVNRAVDALDTTNQTGFSRVVSAIDAQKTQLTGKLSEVVTAINSQEGDNGDGVPGPVSEGIYDPQFAATGLEDFKDSIGTNEGSFVNPTTIDLSSILPNIPTCQSLTLLLPFSTPFVFPGVSGCQKLDTFKVFVNYIFFVLTAFYLFRLSTIAYRDTV